MAPMKHEMSFDETRETMGDLDAKLDDLKAALRGKGRVAVAFSAGVDSTFLLAVAHEVLGDGVVAFSAASPANPQRETDAAARFCAERGIRQIAFGVNELEVEGFDRNPENRCYLCKTHLFGEMTARARAEGIAHVVEGSNVDDLGDYRPGRKALEELGIESPLLEAGMTKADIRALSERMGLPTWDKPSFACLYSRFSYGQLITPELLQRVDAAEQLLLDRGFKTVRVRLADEGAVARIELAPDDLPRAVAEPERGAIVAGLKDAGFAYVALDLQGYRTGSMNETLAAE